MSDREPGHVIREVDWTWRDDAACIGKPTSMFFPPTSGVSGRISASAELAAEPAKAICATCPVRSDCLNDAFADLSFGRYGVRGGMTEHERNMEMARRRRLKRYRDEAG